MSVKSLTDACLHVVGERTIQLPQCKGGSFEGGLHIKLLLLMLLQKVGPQVDVAMINLQRT